MNSAKICIVTTRNIFDAPNIGKYQNIIKEPFDIIYWDRKGTEESCGAEHYYRFSGTLKPDASRYEKIRSYYRFWKFVNRFLSINHYERLIVFPTQAAWLIQRKLNTIYCKKYILDIRDYAGENILLFRNLTAKAIKNSGLSLITSPAYKSFLPSYDYLITHNIQPIDEKIITEYRSKDHRSKDKPIVISYIGSVRFIEQQKKVINCFKNDVRFVLKYIGSGSEQLENYCKQNEVRNVELKGRFPREDISKHYLDCDIALNIYGNNDPYLDHALSNKLYCAAYIGMPILCSPGTYMEKISLEWTFGYPLDINNPDSINNLYNFYCNINWPVFYNKCDEFISSIELNESLTQKKVEEFLNWNKRV